MQSKTTVMILMAFFGKKNGQTLMEFKDELKALSQKEKAELATLAAAQLGCQVSDQAAA